MPMNQEDVHMLRHAAHEIRDLRRRVDRLEARDEVVRTFTAALLGAPREGAMTPDVGWTLNTRADELEANDLPEVKSEDK